MRPAAIILSTLGVVMLIACGLCGALSGLLLSGAGLHGWETSVGWVPGLLAAFMSIFPAGTVGLLRGPWLLPPCVFAGPLLFLVVRVASESGQWWRVPVAAAFVGIGFAGARCLRSRVPR